MLHDYTYRSYICSSFGITVVLIYHKHGLKDVNVIDAQEGRIIHDYKNIKEKFFNTNKATWFDTCADSNTYRLNISIFKLS